jgi:hypothetical protein
VGKPQEKLPGTQVAKPPKEGHLAWVKTMALDIVETRLLQLLNSKVEG